MDSEWLLVWNTITFLLALWAMSDAEKAKRQVRDLEAKFNEFTERKSEPLKTK